MKLRNCLRAIDEAGSEVKSWNSLLFQSATACFHQRKQTGKDRIRNNRPFTLLFSLQGSWASMLSTSFNSNQENGKSSIWRKQNFHVCFERIQLGTQWLNKSGLKQTTRNRRKLKEMIKFSLIHHTWQARARKNIILYLRGRVSLHQRQVERKNISRDWKF